MATVSFVKCLIRLTPVCSTTACDGTFFSQLGAQLACCPPYRLLTTAEASALMIGN